MAEELHLIASKSGSLEQVIMPGTYLPNGAIVLASRMVCKRDKTWIVLCWYPTTLEYVTWVMSEKDQSTIWGDYYSPAFFTEAVGGFERRCKK